LRTWRDINRHEVTLRVQPEWLFASGLIYLAGLCCSGRFYGQILQASSTPIGTAPAIRAYLMSHLGKYVPGKAMVVLMRAGLSTAYGCRAATAAIATFYETLVMMAAGGLVGALGFALSGGSPPLELNLPLLGKVGAELYHLAGLVGLGLGLAFLVVVFPAIFRRLSLLFSMPFPNVGPEALPRFSFGLLASGLFWSTAAWMLLGYSQVAVLEALIPPWPGQHAAFMALVTACVALATVAGFVVAVLPGGLGVREGVLMVALGPSLGQDEAVVAALALRLVWVAAELLAASILLPLGARYRKQANLEIEMEASTKSP
jgi:uncharacterized membrane protein YbhN (UPF0104 family)